MLAGKCNSNLYTVRNEEKWLKSYADEYSAHVKTSQRMVSACGCDKTYFEME